MASNQDHEQRRKLQCLCPVQKPPRFLWHFPTLSEVLNEIIVSGLDYLFKFLIIGSAGVGKSCILHQFMENKCKYIKKQILLFRFNCGQAIGSNSGWRPRRKQGQLKTGTFLMSRTYHHGRRVKIQRVQRLSQYNITGFVKFGQQMKTVCNRSGIRFYLNHYVAESDGENNENL